MHQYISNASCDFVFLVFRLGESVEFKNISALEISNNPAEPEPSEPKIRFVAGIHGNAPVGTELLLEFAAYLCINYGKNRAISKVSVGIALNTLSPANISC